MRTISAIILGSLSVYVTLVTVQAQGQAQVSVCKGNIECQNGGSCKEISASVFQCTCLAGYSGKFCEITPCATAGFPCKRESVCKTCESDAACKAQNPTTFSSINWCACKEGWQGKDCNTERKGNCKFVSCGSNPWKVGGTCALTSSNDVKCNCFTGFSGTFCQNEDSRLSVSPALTTVMKGSKAKFTCTNSADATKKYTLYSGDSFGTNVGQSGDITDKTWTTNDITFNDVGTQQYRCTIVIGSNKFVSNIIQITVTEKEVKGKCQFITCQNGGNCVLGTNGEPRCDCVAQWDGQYCQLDKSKSNPCDAVTCQNKGQCKKVAATGDFKCTCDPPANPDWFGTFCEKARPALNAPCTTNKDCDGTKCPVSGNIGYCKFGEFKCGCKASFGDISCSSNIQCANNCPTASDGKRYGLCLATNKCICFLDSSQYIQYQLNNDYPNGKIFLQN